MQRQFSTNNNQFRCMCRLGVYTIVVVYNSTAKMQWDLHLIYLSRRG